MKYVCTLALLLAAVSALLKSENFAGVETPALVVAQNYDNPAGAGTTAPGQEQRNDGQGENDPHGAQSGPSSAQGRAFDEPLGDHGVYDRG